MSLLYHVVAAFRAVPRTDAQLPAGRMVVGDGRPVLVRFAADLRAARLMAFAVPAM